jgi:hypothetical protein
MLKDGRLKLLIDGKTQVIGRLSKAFCRLSLARTGCALSALIHRHRAHNRHAFDKGKRASVNGLHPFEARFCLVLGLAFGLVYDGIVIDESGFIEDSISSIL